MHKLVLQVCLALAVLASATASHARIFVKITDGTSTIDGSVPGASTFGAFNISKDSLAPPNDGVDYTDVMRLFTCSTPCTVYFPSGATTPQPGDTFAFSDTTTSSEGPPARVVKFDSAASADRISLRGVTIKSLTAGKTLTLNYATQLGDLRTLTTGNAYPGTAAMSGTFRTALGSRATACGDGTTSSSVSTPCVKLQIKVNGITVDGQGTTAIATAAVPCNNSFPDVNPCGTSGTWSSLGTFSGVNDTNSIACPSPCVPNSRGILTAVFKGANETLTLAASTHGAVANIPAPDGGLEEIFLTLSDEVAFLNRWVPYTGADQRCRAKPTGPTDGTTRHVNNNSTIPLSFLLECSFFVPAGTGGITMLSIVDPSEVKLTGAAQTQNDASRVSFLPSALAVNGITVLSFTYDVFVGTGPSGNSTLGDLSFTDCTGGSLRVEFELLNGTTPVGTAKVNLGSNSGDNFQSGCNGSESIGTALLTNTDARVDTSGLAAGFNSSCCITFQQFQAGSTGPLLVRKMTLIVDRGNVGELESPFANHKVTLFDANVNGSTAASFLQVVSPTGFQRVNDLPTEGVSIVIRKLTLDLQPIEEPPVVKIILGPDISINGHQYRSHVNVNEIQPDDAGTKYSVDLCLFGATEGTPVSPTTPGGICIPNQAIMTLL